MHRALDNGPSAIFLNVQTQLGEHNDDAAFVGALNALVVCHIVQGSVGAKRAIRTIHDVSFANGTEGSGSVLPASVNVRLEALSTK
jgi:hypothetical protein